MTRERSKRTLATETSSTQSATLSCHQHGSRIFGGISIEAKLNALGVVVENKTDHPLNVSIHAQTMTQSGEEIAQIANPPNTDLEFLKAVANTLKIELRAEHSDEVDHGAIVVHVAKFVAQNGEQFAYQPVWSP